MRPTKLRETDEPRATRIATREEVLTEERRKREPLPVSAAQVAFRCICDRAHTRQVTSTDVIACACGRSWVPCLWRRVDA